jgi:hypothetical protein
MKVTIRRSHRTKCQFQQINNNSIKPEQLSIILPQLIGYMQEKDLFRKLEIFSFHQEPQDGAPCSLTTEIRVRTAKRGEGIRQARRGAPDNTRSHYFGYPGFKWLVHSFVRDLFYGVLLGRDDWI